jgi:hypothetical protein
VTPEVASRGKDEKRQIAANIAELSELSGKA